MPEQQDEVVYADQTPFCPPHHWVVGTPCGEKFLPKVCKKCKKQVMHKAATIDVDSSFNEAPITRMGGKKVYEQH